MTCLILGWQALQFAAGAPWDVDFIDMAEGDSLLWSWGVQVVVGGAEAWDGAE